MTRTLGFGLSALVAAGALAWTPTQATGWNQGSAEATLWQLLNGARVNNGLAPLQSHGTLVSLARWRSSDMLAKDYFSHTIAGCGCLVYPYYDGNGLSYDWAGENIGWNSGLDDSYSPVRVHEKFMASPGHRVNVLDGRFTHGGIGAAAADNKMFQGYVQNTRMYTELFMQARAAAPPPPPPAPVAPAPAPPPPPSSGGGSGWTAPAAPAAPAAQAPAAQAPAAQAPAAPQPERERAPEPKPKPKPKVVDVAAPSRPVSTAGLDGVSELVAAAPRTAVAARTMIDELPAAATVHASPLTAAKAPADVMARADMQVTAAAPPPPGPVESVVSAVLGFLFG
jgi:uncharacterized protein YkwD